MSCVLVVIEVLEMASLGNNLGTAALRRPSALPLSGMVWTGPGRPKLTLFGLNTLTLRLLIGHYLFASLLVQRTVQLVSPVGPLESPLCPKLFYCCFLLSSTTFKRGETTFDDDCLYQCSLFARKRIPTICLNVLSHTALKNEQTTPRNVYLGPDSSNYHSPLCDTSQSRLSSCWRNKII
jgi:hypothetical protein